MILIVRQPKQFKLMLAMEVEINVTKNSQIREFVRKTRSTVTFFVDIKLSHEIGSSRARRLSERRRRSCPKDKRRSLHCGWTAASYCRACQRMLPCVIRDGNSDALKAASSRACRLQTFHIKLVMPPSLPESAI